MRLNLFFYVLIILNVSICRADTSLGGGNIIGSFGHDIVFAVEKIYREQASLGFELSIARVENFHPIPATVDLGVNQTVSGLVLGLSISNIRNIGQVLFQSELDRIFNADLSAKIQSGEKIQERQQQVRQSRIYVLNTLKMYEGAGCLFFVSQSQSQEVLAVYSPDPLASLRGSGGPPLPPPSAEVVVLRIDELH